MGNQLTLTGAQIEDLTTSTTFTDSEIKRLFRRFKKLDTDKSGALSKEEFLAVPELEHNPLVDRVVATLDDDKNGEVDFEEFIRALSIFTAPSEAHERRTKFAFKMYDVDNDNFISNSDLFHILKAMVGNNLNDVQLQELVDRTLIKGDKDRDGKLNYEEFCSMISDSDIGDRLTLSSLPHK